MGELERREGGPPAEVSESNEVMAPSEVRYVAPEPLETRAMATEPLASERVIINAPMSFAGAAQRAWRMRETAPEGAGQWVLTGAVILFVVPLWWGAVLLWYIAFGLWLVPYRLLRRGARKRKAEALRHREMLDAVDRQRQ